MPLISVVTLAATEQARARYAAMVDRDNGIEGEDDIRQRLVDEGDMASPDGLLGEGLRRYQERHGLEPTAFPDDATLTALRVPLKTRLMELDDAVTLLRKKLAKPMPARMVTVNIPAMEVEAVDQGRVVSRHRAVVGIQQRPSPPLSARIIEVNFHPAWTVPYFIAKTMLIPEERMHPGYLRERGFHLYDKDGLEVEIDAVDWSGEEAAQYTFRQDPGPMNPMGKIRLNMPNALNFFMHDTPVKEHFAEVCRMYSSGCVRVEGIDRLTAWLLRDMPGWNLDRVLAVTVGHEPQTVRVEPPVRVEWIYLTAWATPAGAACFRKDIYLFENARGVP